MKHIDNVQKYFLEIFPNLQTFLDKLIGIIDKDASY